MSKRNLSPRQRDAYQAIMAFFLDKNYPPTGKELANIMGISLQAAQKHIDRLYVKGYIRKTSFLPRGIEFPNEF